METENRKSKTLVGGSKEVDATEESMEYWFNRGVSDVEEGEVVRGRVVEVRDSEILVDIGYKSEGTIPIEEFRHAGSLPKVGEEIEVYLESKEDNEGLIVLSKDKADKIKVWDQISKAHDSGTPVEGRVAEVVKVKSIVTDEIGLNDALADAGITVDDAQAVVPRKRIVPARGLVAVQAVQEIVVLLGGEHCLDLARERHRLCGRPRGQQPGMHEEQFALAHDQWSSAQPVEQLSAVGCVQDGVERIGTVCGAVPCCDGEQVQIVIAQHGGRRVAESSDRAQDRQ